MKKLKASVLATAAAATMLGTLAVAAPAEAAGMRAVTGRIACTAYPNITIGTSAVAKGTVQFQLNNPQNTRSNTVSLGYSAAYTSWGWKFWTNEAGNFYAYGLGANGNVTSAKRYCQAI
ncbi:hypothetical protein ROT00_08705 [Agromyces mediolanus]|uniref:hypothetical protein n=1 Tax=Agromyces mediolanus TaxID=41986 RepID=UPI003834FC68